MLVLVLLDVARNHRSWFARGREVVEFEGVTLFLGDGDAVLAFPDRKGDLAAAVQLARESGANEVGCWALRPDDDLAAQLSRLGFQDGWQPHWMGTVIATTAVATPMPEIVATRSCNHELPYSTPHHESVVGGDVHHFVARKGAKIVGHTVLNIDGDTGGIYDMGVAPPSRRRGYGRALTLTALASPACSAAPRHPQRDT